MNHRKHPLALLQDIEQRSLQNTHGLPQRAETRALWHGIGFRIGDITLVAPLMQVNEILHYPKLTLVPGTLGWVKGLANIRGTLLPVMDLRGYLGQSAISHDAHSRIMVVQQENLSVGLLVDEVLGLKHFDPQEAVTRVKKLNEAVKPYIQGAFFQSNQTWYVFNMTTLAEHPQFLQVAV